ARARRARRCASGAGAVSKLGAAIGPCPADLRDRDMSGTSVRRAIAMLRTGRPVRIADVSVAAVETTSRELLDLRDPERRAPLIISGNRAAALKLANEREAANPEAPVIIERADWLDADAALALADAGRDLDRGPTGPLQPVGADCVEAAGAALTLARSAGLLPALWMLVPAPTDFHLSVEEVARERAQPTLEIVARAKLPLEGLPAAQIIAFRASDDGQEH